MKDMDRVMLHEMNVPKNFWEEALSTTINVINTVYLRPNTIHTPYELWYGKKPNLRHMRVFGSPYWVFNDRESLGKFDCRGEPSIFLGYGKNTKAYTVLIKSTGVMSESMNVIKQSSLWVETITSCIL